MKSYGRAPTFLLATGHEQARSVAAYLAGDEEAARRVELELPETGVCSGPAVTAETSKASSCCGPAAPQPAAGEASACCGLAAAKDVPKASGCCGPTAGEPVAPKPAANCCGA
jgi:hypothetical protein